MISNNNCKVCILSILHSASDNRVFHKEAKTIVRAGYDVVLIICHDRNETVDGVKIIALCPAKNRFVRMTFMAAKAFVLALKQKTNIYHFHDPELMGVAVLLKLFTGAKIIYDVHEDTPKSILSKDWINRHLRIVVAFIFDIIEKNISRYFDCIFAATASIAENFKKCNVVLLSNYPDVSRFPEKRERQKNDCYTLFYCGGLSKIRGIKEIVLALGFIKQGYNIRLRLAGKFDDPKFEKEVNVLKEWSRVEYLGYLSKADVIKNYYLVDCGLICIWPEPGHLKAIGDKLFEYMLAGLPVIASDFQLWKEIVEENGCGICVDPLDPQDIAQAVEFLIENPLKAKLMGDNGRKAVLEKYSWDKESEKLLRVYAKLCKIDEL